MEHSPAAERGTARIPWDVLGKLRHEGGKADQLPLGGLGMLSPPSPVPILSIPVAFLSRALSIKHRASPAPFFLACFDWCISCCSSALPAVDVGRESWKAEDDCPTFVSEQTPSVPSTAMLSGTHTALVGTSVHLEALLPLLPWFPSTSLLP